MKKNIINSYRKASLDYGYNSNSLHKLGFDARKLEEAASNQILDVLGLIDYEVIYTSGNAESYTMILNNLNGNLFSDNEKLKKIALEMGINVVDIYEDNSFVSVKCEKFFSGKINHIDIDLSNTYENLSAYDFITIEDDLPFFGVLIKKRNIELENVIHGGKSTTKYRSGTSATPLIVAFSKLVKLKYKK